MTPTTARQMRDEKCKTAGDKFRSLAVKIRNDWLIGCIPPRANWSVEAELFRSGIAEILSLRLRVAYMPLLQGLQRIENRVNILTEIREEPYAPKADRRGRISVS